MVTDSRLSLRTKGLMAVLLSRPPDWEYSVSGLAVFCGVSRDIIRISLKELEAAGYLTRRQLHGDKGQFGGNEYIIRETSSLPDNVPSEGETSPLTRNPATAEPSAAEPLTDLSPQINKDLNQERLKEEPPKAPQGGRRRRRTTVWEPEWKPDRFNAFWEFYRTRVCKEGRAQAVRAWDKLQPDEDTIEAMARDLKARLKTEQWQRGIGIPYASTYINQQRWQDGPGRSAGETAQQVDAQEETTVRSNLPSW